MKYLIYRPPHILKVKHLGVGNWTSRHQLPFASQFKAMPHRSEKSPEKNRNEILHSLCMPDGRVKMGRRELGLETNSDHLPWRIRTTSLENSAQNSGEFRSIFGEFGLLFELNNL